MRRAASSASGPSSTIVGLCPFLRSCPNVLMTASPLIGFSREPYTPARYPSHQALISTSRSCTLPTAAETTSRQYPTSRRSSVALRRISTRLVILRHLAFYSTDCLLLSFGSPLGFVLRPRALRRTRGRRARWTFRRATALLFTGIGHSYLRALRALFPARFIVLAGQLPLFGLFLYPCPLPRFSPILYILSLVRSPGNEGPRD